MLELYIWGNLEIYYRSRAPMMGRPAKRHKGLAKAYVHRGQKKGLELVNYSVRF